MPPIRPEQVATLKAESIPEEVFECVNNCIIHRVENGRAIVKQEDIINELASKGFDKHDIFNKGWLNFEEHYRKVGWKVEYDKPAYNESYPARFIFTAA